MTKIQSIDELPKWFDIKKYYPKLSSISDQSLAHQLTMRVLFLGTDERFKFDYTTHEKYKSIISSKPILHDYFDSLNKSTFKEVINKYSDVYTYGDSIRLASLGDLILAGQGAEVIMENIKKNDVYDDPDGSLEGYFESLSYDILDHNFGQNVEILLKVRLEFSDEEIIRELTDSLQEYRKKTQAEQPKKPVHSIQYYLKKALAYRLIPIMDLLLWAKANGKIIPNHILALKVGPKGEIGETTIARNSIPLIKELTSVNSQARRTVTNHTLQKI